MKTVGVAILTYNAGADIYSCLLSIHDNATIYRCLILDSNSTDGTLALAKQFGADIYSIKKSDFNHGVTRELARKLLGTDIVVMLTQDAFVTGPESIAALVAPLLDGRADVAYGRQLPKPGADIFESFPREFNYPAQSQIRRLSDAPKLGAFTFFCSDSFAAYKQSSLDAIGGFPTVLTNEDYFAVARILENGGAIAYVAEATVLHSHRYTLKQEFQRYFDTGYVRGERPWVQQLVGNAEGHGASMVKALFLRLLKTQPWLIPYAILQVGAKWLGYRIGFYSINAPLWWKKALSGQKYYWTSKYAAQPADKKAKQGV
jgi:rhamnosyltransferase